MLCVTGDVVGILDNLYEDLLPGIVTSSKDVLGSMKSIRMRADRFVPAHDPSLKPFQQNGFPETRKQRKL